MEFPDGQVKEYAASIVAENMLTQYVDSHGISTTLMEAIVDYVGMKRRHFNIMTSMFKP